MVASTYFVATQQNPIPVVPSTMTYAFLTISREEEGRQIVRRPRVTDVIGHALRDAFDDRVGLPDDMAKLLRELDAAPGRLH